MADARSEMLAADQLVSDELAHANVAVCMNFLDLHPHTQRLTYANAGMPTPLLFHYGQPTPEPLNAVGMYVGGGYARTRVTPESAQAQLQDGDIILMFTDG